MFDNTHDSTVLIAPVAVAESLLSNRLLRRSRSLSKFLFWLSGDEKSYSQTTAHRNTAAEQPSNRAEISSRFVVGVSISWFKDILHRL
jgi:hypothetical protein